MPPGWDVFCQATKDRPPREILVKALELVPTTGKAIDIGAGALNETRYLLQKGFEVTAIDAEPSVAKEAKKLKNKKLHFHLTRYEDFDFPKNQYVLAVAMFALPFTNPSSFSSVLRNIFESLKSEAVFVGHFFGIKDEWNRKDSGINFHTKAQLVDLFKDFSILSLKEIEEEGKTATGQNKHWHFFEIIARRKA